MPRSRKRKKKKKRIKGKDYRQKKTLKRTVVNGIELTLDGKNLIIKNKRSPEEHKEYLKQLKENRPQMLKNLEDAVSRVTTIFNEYDNLMLLGYLSYNHYKLQMDPDDDGMAEVSLEYAHSFAMAIKENPQKKPTKNIFREVKDLLYDIRRLYNAYLMIEVVEDNYSETEHELRFRMILEALHGRGAAYTNHFNEIFLELFGAHDRFFNDHYGFNAKDILDTFNQLEDSYFCRMILPNGMPHPSTFKRFSQWQEAEGITAFRIDDTVSFDRFLEANPDLVQKKEGVRGFHLGRPDEFKDLHRIRFRNPLHEKVAKAVSQEFGDNEAFLDPRFPGLPLNDTTIIHRPILEYEGNLYLFAFNLPARFLFNIAENLLKKADKTYHRNHYLGNRYANTRDNYLEQKTTTLLGTILKGASSYLNLKYRPGEMDAQGNPMETELDLLVISDKANYIVEIKAGGLNNPTRRGALKSLKGQLSETVGYGAYQSYRAYRYIMDNSANVFYDGQGLEVTVDNTKKTFRLTITLEQLSSLLSATHELQKLGILKPKVEMAWTCSLFDLMIFTDILDNEDDFVTYLEQRIPMLTDPRVRVRDEIDVLGYFLEHNSLFDKKLLQKTGQFSYNKYSQEIDDYYERGGKKPVKKR